MDRLDEWSFKSQKMDLEEGFFFDYGAEEMTGYPEPGELLAALKQKEEEVILAAQLGNALLLENRQLKERSDKLHDEYADKLEVRNRPASVRCLFMCDDRFLVQYARFKRSDNAVLADILAFGMFPAFKKRTVTEKASNVKVIYFNVSSMDKKRLSLGLFNRCM